MSSQAYFGDIRGKIIDELESAEHTIKIAMAWFTNHTIFHVVINKAASGVKIELAISDSESNFRFGSSLDFQALQRKGMKVYVINSEGGWQFMHHKFAIIDNKKVITGSYNWSSSAQTNFENIIVTQDDQLAKVFDLQFNSLITKEVSIPLDTFINKGISSPAFAIENTDTAMFLLTKEFNQSVDNAMEEARLLDLGLRLDIVRNMIKRYTAVGAAKKLSNDTEQSGFLKLAAENRIDLTFEYFTAKSCFASLFDQGTINHAKEKLRPYLRDKVNFL
jgi:phosphatidylserine/phosphatidylglycerophosphate/cardiolipin synthase-like enzyme